MKRYKGSLRQYHLRWLVFAIVNTHICRAAARILASTQICVVVFATKGMLAQSRVFLRVWAKLSNTVTRVEGWNETMGKNVTYYVNRHLAINL